MVFSQVQARRGPDHHLGARRQGVDQRQKVRRLLLDIKVSRAGYACFGPLHNRNARSLLFRLLDTKTQCINMGSYNYLGYAESSGPCTEAAIAAVEKSGLTASSSRYEITKIKFRM